MWVWQKLRNQVLKIVLHLSYFCIIAGCFFEARGTYEQGNLRIDRFVFCVKIEVSLTLRLVMAGECVCEQVRTSHMDKPFTLGGVMSRLFTCPCGQPWRQYSIHLHLWTRASQEEANSIQGELNEEVGYVDPEGD